MTEISLEKIEEMIAKGNVEEALKSLASRLKSNGRDVDGWLLMAELMDDPVRKKDCYQQVLKWSPYNAAALKGLEKLASSNTTRQVTDNVNESPRSSGQKAASESPQTHWDNSRPLKTRRKKGTFLWWGLFSIVCCIFSCVVYVLFSPVINPYIQYILYRPKEKKIQAELEQEFKTIDPLSNSTLDFFDSCTANDNNNDGFCWKSYMDKTFVRVKAEYSPGNNTQAMVFNHYDKQLREQGWELASFDGDDTLWGNEDYDRALYSKGEYYACLGYSENSTTTWSYSFSMAWKGFCL